MSCTPDRADDAKPQDDDPKNEPAAAVSSADLLAGKSELLIQHGDEVYRLRITRNGKLILHK